MAPLRPISGAYADIYSQMQEVEKHPGFSLGETYQELGAQSLMDSPGIGTAYKNMMAPELFNNRYVPDGTGHVRVESLTPEDAAAQNKTVYWTEQQYRNSRYYHPDVPWEPGMTEERAKVLFDWQTTKNMRSIYDQDRPVSSVLARFAGGALDPINLIPMTIPGVGEVGLAARFGLVALEGAGANLLTSSLTAYERSRYDRNEGTLQTIAQDTLMGALFAPVLYTGGLLGGMAKNYIKGRSRFKVDIPESPKAPEPQPVQPPVSDLRTTETPGATIISPQGVTATYDAGAGTAIDMRQHAPTENEIWASRVIVNDGNNFLQAGEHPQLSVASQSIIKQLTSDVFRHVEQDRYDINRLTPENLAREKDIEARLRHAQSYTDAAEADFRKVETKLKEIAKKNPQVDDALQWRELYANKPTDVAPSELGLPKHIRKDLVEFSRRLFDMREGRKSVEDVALEKRGFQGFVRNGYLEKVPTFLDNFEWDNVKSHVDLPPEVRQTLPEEVQRKIDDIVAKEPNPRKRSEKIRTEIAQYLGKIYNGVYPVFHGTDAVYGEPSKEYLGTGFGGKSAHEAHFFSSHKTANAYTNEAMDSYLDDMGKTIPEILNNTLNIFHSEAEKFNALKSLIKTNFKQYKEEAKKAIKMVKQYQDAVHKMLLIDVNQKDKLNRAFDSSQQLLKDLIKFADEIQKKANPDPAPNMRPVNLHLKNPYVVDMVGQNYVDDTPKNKQSLTSHILKAKKAGNDGVIFLNLTDPVENDVHFAVWNEGQIDSAMYPARPIMWDAPKMDVNWKTAETDLEKAAKEFSKPMDPQVKFNKEMELEGINTENATGAADPEYDRIVRESAKIGMTEAQAAAFDETVKGFDEDMASDARVVKAVEAVGHCRNR